MSQSTITPNLNKDQMEFGSEAELKEFVNKNKHLRWAIFEDVVYDLDEYLPEHPGGEDMITEHIGGRLDEPFIEQEHSKAAKNVFKSLPKVGVIKKKCSLNNGPKNSPKSKDQEMNQSDKAPEPSGMDGYVLKGSWQPDYNKGMLWQIWTSDITFEQYVQFVTEPKLLINPIRDIILFNTPQLEIFSKTSWYAIIIGWAPIIFYYFTQNELDLIGTIFYTIIGIINWTLLEYIIHRFAFHGEDKWLPRENKTAFVGHFLLHGIHHAFPQDRYRLVFPLLPGYIIMNLILAPPFKMILPSHMSSCFIAGSILGYVMYDMIHYFMHHCSPKSGYWKELKAYHMQHHHKDGKNGYGVSQKFWDLVFDTELQY